MDIRKLKDSLRWKGLKSLEFRVLGWMGRAVVAFAVITYVFASAPQAWSWVQVKHIRMQELSRFDALLEDAAANGNFRSAELWIQARPLSDTAALLARAAPYYDRLSPFAFFNFSDRAARLGDGGQADLWNLIAHFRLRFDLMRCGLRGGVDKGQEMINLLSLTHANFTRDIPDERRRVLAREALAFDLAHPARDNPARLCKTLGMLTSEDTHLMPEDEWDSFRLGMHKAADITLKEGPLFPISEKVKKKETPAKVKKGAAKPLR